MDFQLPGWRTWMQVAYVALVTGLVGATFQDPNDVRAGAWLAALVLTLPMGLPLLPVLYVVGGLAWNLSDADGDGATWPVTVTYLVIFAVVAVVNAVVVRYILSSGTRSRPPRGGSA